MVSTATPLLRLYEGRAHAAAQVVESLRSTPPDQGLFARDLDDVIVTLSESPKQVEKMYHDAWDRAAEGPIAQCVPMGEAVFRIWDAYLDALRSVRDFARSVGAQNGAVTHLPDLDAAIDRLERNRPQAFNGWPWFRPEDEAEALAEHARGESLSLEEVFGALSRPRQ